MKGIISICTAVLLFVSCFTATAAASSETAAPSETASVSTAAAYSEAPTYTDRYWIKDMSFTTDTGLPGNYRTMTDEFGSHKMPVPPDAPAAEGNSETADLRAETESPETATESTEAESAETETGETEPEATGTPLPSREGLDTLCISGSCEYTAESFQAMIEDIRTRTDGVICVFDLRQETHGFVNGLPVSLYAKHNAGNVGLSADEVLALEKKQLGELLGTELTLKSIRPPKADGDSAQEKVTLVDVDEVMTEQELCESLGVEYVRLSCTDHLCPDDSAVDDFMAAYLALPEGSWLHFHCAAGVGRTGLFMMMADMLRNPDVSLDDIISRQVLLGAQDPRSSKGPDGEDSGEKTDLLQRFYDYVQEEESAGFPDTFTEWNQLRQETGKA